MSQKWTILIPGVAKSERKRQRFIPGKGRVGKRTDEPDRADFKSRLAFFVRQAIPAPLTGPVALEVLVTRPRPTSNPKAPTARNPWPDADTKRPDCSNYAKIVEDALNGIAYHDDSQIVDLRVCKGYGEHGVKLVLTELSNEQGGSVARDRQGRLAV